MPLQSSLQMHLATQRNNSSVVNSPYSKATLRAIILIPKDAELPFPSSGSTVAQKLCNSGLMAGIIHCDSLTICCVSTPNLRAGNTFQNAIVITVALANASFYFTFKFALGRYN